MNYFSDISTDFGCRSSDRRVTGSDSLHQCKIVFSIQKQKIFLNTQVFRAVLFTVPVLILLLSSLSWIIDFLHCTAHRKRMSLMNIFFLLSSSMKVKYQDMLVLWMFPIRHFSWLGELHNDNWFRLLLCSWIATSAFATASEFSIFFVFTLWLSKNSLCKSHYMVIA